MEENCGLVSEEATDLEQLMASEILETFPRLEEVPEAIATKFREMIHFYLLTKKASPELKPFRALKHLGKVFDDKGKLVCIFKHCKEAKKEAAVYLLDHPLSLHRSKSSDLIGFGGATPTVFIRTKETSGCLVSYVENDGVVGDYTPFKFKTLPQEIHKLGIFHIRFGSTDCHNRNTVSKIDAEGIHRLTPIDHEECFNPNFNFRRVWWEEKKESKESFTPEMVNYVNKLDVDGDIRFLKTCGWDVPREITVPFKIYTSFLKKAVQFHLTAYDMSVLARNDHKSPIFNLCNMVLEYNPENTHGDELFLQNAYEKMESRLTEYARKFVKKN